MPRIIADVLHQRGSRSDELYLEPAIGLVGNFDVHFHLSYGGKHGRYHFGQRQ
jgi:hypothetical protein